jgi:hypothetical protein
MKRPTEGVLTAPAVAVSLLPKAICPICSPAYTALLSSLGLPFFATTRFLLPMTIAFLVIAEGSLFFRAWMRRGLGPFWLGLVGAVAVLVGKFSINSSAMMYLGVSVLIVASVWNVIPKRNNCPACQTGLTQ